MNVGFLTHVNKNIAIPIIEKIFTNAICYGETGSGKTTGFMLPNIKERIESGGFRNDKSKKFY